MDDAGRLTPEIDGLRREFVGRKGEEIVGPDKVNEAMIRHFCAAVGDTNPVYRDAEVAAKTPHGGVIAPPAMLQAWFMLGYGATPPADDPITNLFALLDALGFSSIVATNCEQEYFLPLRIGDTVCATRRIESLSAVKQTALGRGVFVTSIFDVSNQNGELVARQLHRALKFAPARKAEPAPEIEAVEAPKPLRPRPNVTRDTAFYFEAMKAGKLLLQCCSDCGALRHPPGPSCPDCGSYQSHTVESAGRGTVFSYTVVYAPVVPPFAPPYAVAIVALDEGVRVVAGVTGIEPTEVSIGLPVEVEFVECDPDLTLAYFRPIAAEV